MTARNAEHFPDDPVWQKHVAKMARRREAEPCAYCDLYATDPRMPNHDASERCESGKHNHCTCDTCY